MINKNSIWYDNWLQLKKNKSAMIGLGIILFFIILAILAPVIAPFDPLAQDIDKRLSPPATNGYLFGSDDFGRDILSRIMFGARISLLIGTISVGISLFFGLIFGMFSGYYGGWLDHIVMRSMDLLLAFPYILLAIVIVAALGPSLPNAMIAIGIIGIPQYARIIRSSVLAEKESDYVTAERALGASDMELIFKSILPNCLGPLIVQTTLGYANAIIFSAALSFLGLGALPPTPEWGLMVSSAREYVATAWWVVTFPGLAILFSVLGFNLLGDGLRDALDPRLKS